MVIGNAPAVEKASAKATFLVEARVRVSVPPKVIELVARVVESDKVSTLLFPRVIEEVASVVESEAVRVFPFEMVNVPVELVIVKPLMLVAVAAPKAGVTSVGLVENTKEPVPVSSERESIRYWEVAEVVSCPPVVVNTPLEAVNPEKVIVPDEVKPVRPVNAPPEETSQLVVSMARVEEPPPIATAPVDIPVLILVPKLEESLIDVAAPDIVAPADPVNNPAEVIVPEPLVEMLPEVVIASPAL
jgi:hypothetical protein